MSIQLNHTIVPARDRHASAGFLAGILGIPISPDVARFTPLTASNGVTLDYMNLADNPIQHYAFLVSEDTFDATFERIRAASLTFWADPHRRQEGEIYRSRTGGRGVYFPDPDGHLMELLTRDLTGRAI
ncbi:VOC family protein [Nonomuraea aurantiaca]|jgi:catechol 2,3-dioxygenase-like lactoylglutathione lyase family enzyme|uniref:VOC family protein n=1 Tax=Nonomuraea aurantiaca TaxID=2878562 RepID=UPI001CDA0E66|nr:VOC family protein [Nonomuraea aurantiaca]MCA2227759.1 VOC family protein [Nonomuraea aurantiaca]